MALLSSQPPIPPLPRLPSLPLPYPARVVQHKAKMQMLSALKALVPMDEPRLFVGPKSSLALCRTMAALGHKRVLLVTDSGLTGLGLYDDHVAQLEEVGIEVAVYDGVNPNPTEEEMQAGADVAVAAGGVDAVIGFGGGSSMDAAKIICALLTNDMTVADMEGMLRIRKDPLPMFAIPTTAGTGSEVTVGAVVTNSQDHRKYIVMDLRFIAVGAALDPTLMMGLPPAITAATGMDALTHAIEAAISGIADPSSLASSRLATKLVFENLRRAHADGSDVAAREAMAMASYEGGRALSKAALGYVHSIAHQLGGHYNTPHGVANAVMLPHVLRTQRDAAEAMLAELAVVADIATSRESSSVRADRLIREVDQLRDDLAIPSVIKDLQDADVPTIARRAMDETLDLNAVPRLLRERELEEVVRQVAPR